MVLGIVHSQGISDLSVGSDGVCDCSLELSDRTICLAVLSSGVEAVSVSGLWPKVVYCDLKALVVVKA